MVAGGLPDFVHAGLRIELALRLTSQSVIVIIIIMYDLICPLTKALASFP